MWRLVFALSIGIAQYGHAQGTHPVFGSKKPGGAPVAPLENLPDAGESSDPGVQPDENVGNFSKGIGAAPKNKNSAKVKGLVKLKGPVVGGSGCPEGTVGVALTPDNKTLSLVFDNYIVQAGRSTGLKRDIKSCSITLPVEVPAGYQFAVVKLDYRGFNSIPKNGRTRYLTIYSFLDGNSGKQLGKRVRRQFGFKGPIDEEYVISSDVSSSPIWSRCGKSVNFRVDTRAAAVTNGKGDDVMGMIDSIDAAVGTSVEYHLLWQECT